MSGLKATFVAGVILTCCAATMLSGCAVSSAQGGDASAMPRLELSVIGPDKLGETVDAAQRVAFRFGERRIVFDARLTIAADGLRLVSLDGLGTRMTTLTWSKNGIEISGKPLPEALQPNTILTDIVVIYWPLEVLRSDLKSKGMTLTQSDRIRRILHGDREIVRIDYEPDIARAWSGLVRYKNSVAGYEIEIKSVRIGE